MLLVCRFQVPAGDEPVFLGRARRAVELLSGSPGARHVGLGRAVDRQDRWVLVARFESVVAYRRALSPFEVREHVIPLLAEALVDEPGAYETLLEGEAGSVVEHPSLLAE